MDRRLVRIVWTLAAALTLCAARRAAAETPVPDGEDVEQESQLTPDQKAAALEPPDRPAAAALDPELQRKALALLQGKGKWAFEFVYVRADGGLELVTAVNEDLPVIPASTMKLFTGWLGYARRLKPVSYLRSMLRFSKNAWADEVLRLAGGPKALRAYLESAGLSTESFKTVDGSGRDASDRVTADLEASLLARIHAGASYKGFRDCLAQPGVPSTLQEEGRLADVRGLYAKTGTLPKTGVYSLAGYVEGKSGTLVFSIIGNSVTVGSAQARAAIDAVVRLHAAAMERHEASLVDAFLRPRLVCAGSGASRCIAATR